MNKNQKEVLASQLKDEKAVLNNLKNEYATALKNVEEKIKVFQTDIQAKQDALSLLTDENQKALLQSEIQSKIYQKQYQQALKKQISAIYDNMNSNQYDTIKSYIDGSYESGYLGTMYDLQGQGIPIINPIDQTQVIQATINDTKLSKPLYESLGYNVDELKKQVNSEISRGIATGSSFDEITRNIKNRSNVTLNKAFRIARTEGHRVSQQAAYNAQKKAIEAGADVVKQWDAALDKRTRKSHARVDGQLKELEEPFDNGLMFPGDPKGSAEEVINCRCALLQRAKWALDEDELETLKKRAEQFGLDKTDSFKDFKSKYIEAVKTDPNEGKVFHMNPDGTLEEGEIPGKDTYYLNGLTGEVTELDKGVDYANEVLSMNEDGTFSFGKVKNQAQYKANLENNKVLNLNIHGDFDGLTGDEKIKKIIAAMPQDLQDEVQNTYKMLGGADTYENITKMVLNSKGYDAIDVLYNANADEFIKIFDDSLITKTKKSKLETLSASLNTQQKKLNKIDDKTYTGLWKDDVKVSDYSIKKTSIQAKKDYYLQKIKDAENITVPDLKDNVIKQCQKYLDDLDEFEKLGSEYEQISDKIKKIQSDIKKYTPKTSVMNSGDAFTQDRKDNAHWFTDKNGSTKAADGVLRDESGKVWRSASDFERTSINGYTSSYHKFNEPLRGIEYGTNKYLGVGNVDLNAIGVSYSGYAPGQVKKEIDAITDIIGRSEYDFDIWLQRGVGYKGMDNFFGIDANDFYLSESELSAKLLGTTPTEYGFMSTAVSKGKGFSGGVIMNIYAPEGTKMMYAEPFSAFGNGDGRSWDGISKQSSFGTEAEMILQRGTKFRITKVEKNNGTWYIDMDVIGQEVN